MNALTNRYARSDTSNISIFSIVAPGLISCAEQLQNMLDPIATEVLTFWFGPADDPKRDRPKKFWFYKDPAFDAEVRTRFGAIYQHAAVGQYDAWQNTAEGALALAIALDQFPRNIFRGEARSFASDSQALAVARQAIARGFDRQLLPVQRWFLYLPYEHCEDLKTQEDCVALFELLEGDLDSASSINYARRHRDVIAQFGRFPHRNAILNRPSTAAELDFLSQPGSSF
ncbi:MAG: DUF924 family protein [Cyanobacteria bacterium J06641_5]